jgi:GMP synthase (glutamine-hydrolysing)
MLYQLDDAGTAAQPRSMSHRIDKARRVLVVLHQHHSTPGRVGRLLTELGVELDIRRPRLGDPLPTTLADHAGAVIFGGPMSANDQDDWVRQEIDWISVPLKEEKPFLGICLGAQMLARHLGQRVFFHPQGKVEIGYYPIYPTDAADEICACPFPNKVYQWHREGFDLPHGATLLARGADFETQAIRYGRNAFGLQFHPEVTYWMMCRWTMRTPSALDKLPGAQTRDQHLDGWYRHDRATAQWLSTFLATWLADEPVPVKAAAE